MKKMQVMPDVQWWCLHVLIELVLQLDSLNISGSVARIIFLNKDMQFQKKYKQKKNILSIKHT